MFNPYYFPAQSFSGGMPYYGNPFYMPSMGNSFLPFYCSRPHTSLPQITCPCQSCFQSESGEGDTESTDSSSPPCQYRCRQHEQRTFNWPQEQDFAQSSVSHIPSGYVHIRVWHSTREPWLLPPNTTISYSSHTIRCSTSLRELLELLGANNSSASRNVCAEMSLSNIGRWHKNWEFSGNENDMMQKTLTDIGWDRAHTGAVGNSLIVNVWVKKD
ncbi:hypothetical protein BROUX41_006567 [Berkeleyomyces rouxiae]|uniref:uncharacterized protein n=1 Tax=Berkeleyomyces rouxiae TaxID=2035830 RepID=UPI003B797BE9